MFLLRKYLLSLAVLFVLAGCSPTSKYESYVLALNQTKSSFLLDKDSQDFLFSNALHPVTFTVYTVEGETFVANNLPVMEVTLRPHEKVYWYADIKQEDGTVRRAVFNVEMRRALGKWDGVQRVYTSGKHKRLLETVHYFQAKPNQESTVLNLGEFRGSPFATIHLKGHVNVMNLTLEAPPGEKLVFEENGTTATKWNTRLEPFRDQVYTFTTENAEGFRTSRPIEMIYEKVYPAER